ncbi:MAG: serine O-acetyltransferase [Succinivibrio sp.]|nr:serine O-acetyltransferase [Succinivibrio sp.]
MNQDNSRPCAAAAALPERSALWQKLRDETALCYAREPLLKECCSVVLDSGSLEQAVGAMIAFRLRSKLLPQEGLKALCEEALGSDPSLIECALCDLQAVSSRDPAVASSLLQPFLFLKGPLALESWRVAHWLWQQGRREMALFLQSLISMTLGVDIHPAATIGRGIMLDHATGIVIGETAVVGDLVSILHSVTLGGTGKERGDRHPKVGRGVMIGAGAKILGNISVGECAKIGAGSVVLKDVPAHATVAGVPAVVVGRSAGDLPSLEMEQNLLDDACPLLLPHQGTIAMFS